MNNREMEDKLEAYRQMLATGQIDETTFNNMVQRNLGSGIDVNKAKRPRKSFGLLLVVVLLCVLVFALFKLLHNDSVPSNEREYEYVNSYSSIDAPIQTNYTGSTTIYIRDIPVRMDYVANYEVSGRVVAKASYISNGVANEAAKIDIALVWGKLATDEYLKMFTFKAPGNRFVYWKTTDMDWYRAHTNDSEIISMYSNNHLVTTDETLKNDIKSVKKGDYIRIKGYLVNMYWEENNSDRTWISSTVRTDDGDGACEIIYVTDLKWLKEA